MALTISSGPEDQNSAAEGAVRIEVRNYAAFCTPRYFTFERARRRAARLRRAARHPFLLLPPRRVQLWARAPLSLETVCVGQLGGAAAGFRALARYGGLFCTKRGLDR